MLNPKVLATGEAVPTTPDLLAKAYEVEALIRVCRLAVRDVHDGNTAPDGLDLPAVEYVLKVAVDCAAGLAKQIDRAGA